MELSLTTLDKLSIARETLAGKERDYFRLTLLGEPSGSTPERREEAKQEIERLQARVEELAEQAEAEKPKSVAPGPSADEESTPEE